MKRFANTFKAVVLATIVAFGLTPAICSADCPEIISGETKIGAEIVSPSYMDCWTFQGAVNDRVIITAVETSGTLDTVICLYPPAGGPAEACTSPPYDDKLDHQLQQSGLYTIVVRDYGYNDEGAYNITFLDLPDGPVSSPGDPDGGLIASGETLSGTIVASDMDAFQFYGDVNDWVIITAVETSGTLDTVISLYPPDGGPVEAYTSPPYDDKLEHRLEQFGLYTIVVLDNGYNDEGAYNITFLDLPDGPVYSPNDPNGGPIASGETLSGTIVASDMDAFQFYGDVNDWVIITAVETSGTLDTVIRLYPPDGGPVEAYTSPPYDDKLEHPLEHSGLYTIVVLDNGYNDEGAYNITFLDLPDGPVSSANDPDGGPIASGETLSGTIVASDMDAFQLYGCVNDWVIITAVETSGTLDTVIRLYPPDGGPVEAYTSPPYDDELEHGLEQSGLYTIVVLDNGYDDEGTYNISFLKIPATIPCLCLYALVGDLNDDCKVDWLDFALMAENWLIDCNLTPGDPACIPK